MDEAWLKQHVWPRFSRVLARGGIYLANHSLGRPPDRAAEDVREALDAWYRDMDGAWDGWLKARQRFRARTAQLVGAARSDCIVPKMSAGQGLRAVLNALAGKPRVVTSDGEFDSIDFILRVYSSQAVTTHSGMRVPIARMRTRNRLQRAARALPADLAAALRGGGAAASAGGSASSQSFSSP